MAPTQQQLVDFNLQQRKLLIATSPVNKLPLPLNTEGAPGGTSRIRLNNVGFTKKLTIQVSMYVDIATAAATLSAKGPYNLINRITLIDYAGNNRISCSGMGLFIVNCNRYRTLAGYNNESATAVFTNPTVPTAVGNNQLLTFFLEVPLTYSDTDLRGLMNTQTAVGQSMLQIDWNNSLYSAGTSDDSVYSNTANTTSTVAIRAGTTINVQAVQEFFSPQANQDGSIYAPQMDMMTVYSIQGGLKSNDNIALNMEKTYPLPNLQSVIGFYYAVRVNGLMDCTTPTRHRLMVNGTNTQFDLPNAFQLWEQRRYLNTDTRAGQYAALFRDRPLETALLGNCTHGVTFGAVSGACDVEYTIESYYPLNATMPGLSQG